MIIVGQSLECFLAKYSSQGNPHYGHHRSQFLQKQAEK